MADFYVSISNNISVTDNEEDQLVPLIVDVNDAITIAEDNPVILICYPYVNDAVIITEDETEDIRKEASVSDAITITESISLLLPTLNISLSDLIVITEDEIEDIRKEVWVFDSITASDTESELVPALNISISDAITIAEALAFLNTIHFSISETLTAGESDHEDLGWQGSVSDSITVSDTEDESVPILYLLISDSITIAESASLLIPKLYLSKSDALTIAESITTLGKLFRSVSTSITVADIEDELDIIHISKSDSIKIIDRFITAPVDPDFAICKTITSVHTMLTSSQRSAGTAYSDVFKVKSTVMVRFHIQITAISGIPTLVVTPQVSPDNSVWYDETALDTMYQADNYTDTLKWPGAYVRLKYVIAGTATPKVTFSAKLVKHMPVREPVLI